jgi:hypothetical protein
MALNEFASQLYLAASSKSFGSKEYPSITMDWGGVSVGPPFCIQLRVTFRPNHDKTTAFNVVGTAHTIKAAKADAAQSVITKLVSRGLVTQEQGHLRMVPVAPRERPKRSVEIHSEQMRRLREPPASDAPIGEHFASVQNALFAYEDCESADGEEEAIQEMERYCRFVDQRFPRKEGVVNAIAMEAHRWAETAKMRIVKHRQTRAPPPAPALDLDAIFGDIPTTETTKVGETAIGSRMTVHVERADYSSVRPTEEAGPPPDLTEDERKQEVLIQDLIKQAGLDGPPLIKTKQVGGLTRIIVNRVEAESSIYEEIMFYPEEYRDRIMHFNLRTQRQTLLGAFMIHSEGIDYWPHANTDPFWTGQPEVWADQADREAYLHFGDCVAKGMAPGPLMVAINQIQGPLAIRACRVVMRQLADKPDMYNHMLVMADRAYDIATTAFINFESRSKQISAYPEWTAEIFSVILCEQPEDTVPFQGLKRRIEGQNVIFLMQSCLEQQTYQMMKLVLGLPQGHPLNRTISRTLFSFTLRRSRFLSYMSKFGYGANSLAAVAMCGIKG